MRKDGRSKEAIYMLELAGRSPSYRLKAQAQIGLCHRSLGDHGAAIQAFRAALNDQSASQEELIDVQYFLARTLESFGQTAEAVTLLRRISQLNPRFKDAAYPAKAFFSKMKRLFKDVALGAKDFSARGKHPTNGERGGASNGSWFSNVFKSFNRW